MDLRRRQLGDQDSQEELETFTESDRDSVSTHHHHRPEGDLTETLPPALNHNGTDHAAQSAPQQPTGGSRAVWRRIFNLFIFLLIMYVFSAITVYSCPWIQDAMIYVHHVKTPLFANYSDPSSFDLKATREFELIHDDGCVIQVWQVLPKHYHHSDGFLSEASYTTALSDGSPVILYMHGNTGTRATHHRVQLYKYLAGELAYHVITFDYRGFANSECYPSESGMMEDGGLVWRWVRETAPSARIYIWGHSLGSAAATYLTKELCITDDTPVGLILDAPFPDMVSAAENHPLSMPYWPIMPYFSHYVLQSFEERFESAQRMKYIRSPVLILHGERDFVVPFHLGQRVYRAALRSRKKDPSLGRVDFVNCGESGHKDNFETKPGREALKKFVVP